MVRSTVSARSAGAANQWLLAAMLANASNVRRGLALG